MPPREFNEVEDVGPERIVGHDEGFPEDNDEDQEINDRNGVLEIRLLAIRIGRSMTLIGRFVSAFHTRCRNEIHSPELLRCICAEFDMYLDGVTSRHQYAVNVINLLYHYSNLLMLFNGVFVNPCPIQFRIIEGERRYVVVSDGMRTIVPVPVGPPAHFLNENVF